ncbi:MAG: glycoside hydrolase family 5 protein [Chitinophagales bacterium]|nr:glycoside hydrolase family 5 protein [Chitinophagales bacterium]
MNVYKISILLLFLWIITSCKKDEVKSTPEQLLYAVKGDNPAIYNQKQQQVLLRGVNYNVLGDYWQGNIAVPTTKSYDKEDFKKMASHGMNCVRLIFNWSKLEPQKGVINQAYIQEIEQAVKDAGEYGIYVLLDMHQDAWGKSIVSAEGDNCELPNNGWDGAPEWATFTDGASTCRTTGRESAPAVIHAFQNFWDNKDNIQDEAIWSWAELVKATAKYPNVVGYDLLNEPGLGYKPITQELEKVAKYYRKLIAAIRNAEATSNGLEHIAFFETTITWNGQPLPGIVKTDFTDEPNIVFAPHNYFESISYELTIEQGYELLQNLSKLYKMSMFIGEWGFFGDTALDKQKLMRFAKLEDQALASSTWWQWAQAPGDPHAISWDGTVYAPTSLHLIELDANAHPTGNINDTYLRILARTRPLAIHGSKISFTSNPETGNFVMSAFAGKEQGITQIWIPNWNKEPQISGNNIELLQQKTVNGGWIADFKVEGDYNITINN